MRTMGNRGRINHRALPLSLCHPQGKPVCVCVCGRRANTHVPAWILLFFSYSWFLISYSLFSLPHSTHTQRHRFPHLSPHTMWANVLNLSLVKTHLPSYLFVSVGNEAVQMCPVLCCVCQCVFEWVMCQMWSVLLPKKNVMKVALPAVKRIQCRMEEQIQLALWAPWNGDNTSG